MERLLWLYGQRYEPEYPVICFDERPCFLIGEAVAPLSMQSGSVKKEHYAYEKNDSCCLLLAIERLTGRRVAEVYTQRTKHEYASFMEKVATAFPNAAKIRLVQDNLNTHNTSSFYENFDAQKAFELSQRFAFFYTPKSASWLNMVEIEFSALSKQCLNRRIPTIEKLSSEVLAIVKEREEKKIKINWQFSVESARGKMNSRYTQLNPDN